VSILTNHTVTKVFNLHPNSIPTIINDLAQTQYSLIEHLFTPENVDALQTFYQSEFSSGLFRLAMIAGHEQQVLEKNIRSDLIHWLSAVDLTRLPLQPYAAFFAEFTLALNRELFLGINHHDMHFSFYPLEAFYSTHLDQARNRHARKITFIHYLNRDWKPGDGGELRLYLNKPQTDFIDIAPAWGRSLFFVSDHFYHEVRPSLTHTRQSLSGWFSAGGI